MSRAHFTGLPGVGNGSKLYAFGMIVCMTNVANTVQSSYSKWSAKYVEVAGAISKDASLRPGTREYLGPTV